MKPEHVDTGQGLSRDEEGRLFWVQLYAAPKIHH